MWYGCLRESHETRMKTSSSTAGLGAILLLLVFLATTWRTAHAAAPLVGLWRFDEGGGTNVTDSSGLGNDGWLVGQNGSLPTWVSSQTGFGGALAFTNDGTDYDYVNIPGSASLMIGQTSSNAWAITAWAYENSGGTGDYVASYGRIVVVDGGEAFQFESGASGDGQLYTWARQNTGWQIGWGDSSPVAPLLDQWVHWAVVYDGTNLTIFRNGNQGAEGGTAVAALSAALGYAGYTGSVQIGSEPAQPASRNWNGMLDDVAMFAGALSESEVQKVMAGDFSAHLGGPARILSPPQDQTALEGSDVTFSVAAHGQAPLTYSWYFNGTNLLSWATNSTLILTNIQPGLAGNYSVTVRNGLGSDSSQPAALTVSTFTPLLVGLWRFNEGSGTNVADSSGFGNDGFLVGENGNLPKWEASQAGFGDALRFVNDGSSHLYAAIPGSSSLMVGQTASNAWTLTAWAYEDSGGSGTFFATYGRILVVDEGDAFQVESGADGDGQMYTWSRRQNAWQIGWSDSSPVAPLLDQWVHWAVVYDTTNLIIYRNGNQGAEGGMATTSVSAPLGGGGYSGAIDIGSEPGQEASRTWNGLLDDIAVFNAALSADQIRTVMGGDFGAFLTRPPLYLNISQGTILLSWPKELAGYRLQASPSLLPAQWDDVLATKVPAGASLTVSLPANSRSQFFRLVSP